MEEARPGTLHVCITVSGMEHFCRPVPMATRSRGSFGQENRAHFSVWQGYVAQAVQLGVSACGLPGSAAVSSVRRHHTGASVHKQKQCVLLQA